MRSYGIAGILVVLLGAIAEEEIDIPSSPVIAERGTEANKNFLVCHDFPAAMFPWKLASGIAVKKHKECE